MAFKIKVSAYPLVYPIFYELNSNNAGFLVNIFKNNENFMNNLDLLRFRFPPESIFGRARGRIIVREKAMK